MRLTPQEWRALELAWQAYGRGSVPVGAVASDASGSLFEGRSRMYEPTAPAGELANSLLAHAEVNALTKLDPRTRHDAVTLTSTLEPCPLCLGAIAMATVGRLRFLGADPYGGAVGKLAPTAHTERVPLEVEGPRDDDYGRLAAALYVAFYVERKPEGHVVRTHRTAAPATLADAEGLLRRGAGELARQSVPFAEALEPLLQGLAETAVRP